MNKPVEIEVISEGDLTIATLKGELGLSVSNLDREFTLINASRPQIVILDMRQLTFVSSLGMGLFVQLRNTLRRHDGRLFAVGPQRMVLDSFHRSRLDGLFEVRATMEDALLSAERSMPEALKARV